LTFDKRNNNGNSTSNYTTTMGRPKGSKDAEPRSRAKKTPAQKKKDDALKAAKKRKKKLWSAIKMLKFFGRRCKN
jgi:hypothetical protein